MLRSAEYPVCFSSEEEQQMQKDVWWDLWHPSDYSRLSQVLTRVLEKSRRLQRGLLLVPRPAALAAKALGGRRADAGSLAVFAEAGRDRTRDNILRYHHKESAPTRRVCDRPRLVPALSPAVVPLTVTEPQRAKGQLKGSALSSTQCRRQAVSSSTPSVPSPVCCV